MKEERQSLFQYTSGPFGESSCPKNAMVSPKSAMLHASKSKSTEGKSLIGETCLTHQALKVTIQKNNYSSTKLKAIIF